jgi:hypothetical protein
VYNYRTQTIQAARLKDGENINSITFSSELISPTIVATLVVVLLLMILTLLIHVKYMVI